MCLFQVNEIYQDHSLGANINVVLVKIIMLSPSKVLNCDSVSKLLKVSVNYLKMSSCFNVLIRKEHL